MQRPTLLSLAGPRHAYMRASHYPMDVKMVVTGLDVLTRNNVRISGSGPRPILFAHGFGCDQNMWRLVQPAFTGEHTTVLFDYVGSGQSDLSAYDPVRYGSLAGYADDVLEVCEALGLRDVVFVGHSVSSMIGVLAANRRPELFHSLILVGPSPRYVNDPPDYVGGFERTDLEGLFDMMDRNYIGWATFMGSAVMANPERPELGEELTRSFCSTDPVIARRFAEATFYADNRSDLPRVRVPTLILQCAEDMIAPDAVGEYVHHNLPDSTLRRLEATGHCPHLSHPDEIIAEIRAFLSASEDRDG